jgi:hypothetical protein
MPNESTGKPGTETSDYSATVAPENREHVTSRATSADPALIPGGLHGVPVDPGMSELHREDVPSQAEDLDLTQYGESPARERAGSGKE